MATSDDETPPAPTEPAPPDWTYEELINGLIAEHAADLHKKQQANLERGLYPRFPITLFVEDRFSDSCSLADTDPLEGRRITKDRFWLLDESGFAETDHSEYQEMIGDFEGDDVLAATCSFSVVNFRFENNYRHLIWSSYVVAYKRFSSTENHIYRKSDGKLSFEYLLTLAMN